MSGATPPEAASACEYGTPFAPFFKQKMPTKHSVRPVVVNVGGRTTVIEIVFVIEVLAIDVASTCTVNEDARFVGELYVARKFVVFVNVPQLAPEHVVFVVGMLHVTPRFFVSPPTVAVRSRVCP